MRCTENCNAWSWNWSREMVQFFSWAMKFGLICHIHLPFDQLAMTSSNISTTFHRKNVSTISRMEKMLSRCLSNHEAQIFMLQELKKKKTKTFLSDKNVLIVQLSSVVQPCPNLCHPMDGWQHARIPCPSPTPGDCSNLCPSNWWCHPTISSSATPFFSWPQSSPALGTFLMSWLFTSGGQSIGALASILPMSIQNWFPLGWTGLIFLQPKGL